MSVTEHLFTNNIAVFPGWLDDLPFQVFPVYGQSYGTYCWPSCEWMTAVPRFYDMYYRRAFAAAEL